MPRSRSASRTTLRNMNSDGSELDDGDPLKKSRSYDKVYRTNEPLHGKPNNEFPEKKWDLDDEDITSSEGTEYNMNEPRVAKDIEYINKGDKPKQTGRRSLRLQSDYQPIEEEPNSYLPPPPVESPSPVNYSPTYSGLDRNSSFMNEPQQQQQSPPIRPPSGAVRVLPTGGDMNNPFGRTLSPQPTQDVGLPKINTKSTEV